ncbi:MAG: hypothetical protein IIT65_15220 [Lachnospiraceae bacterium]|nr:hypothetical protein [Lachnospiraceae bacterium]
MFNDITVNGRPLSDLATLRALAQELMGQSRLTDDYCLFLIGASLDDLVDEVSGATAARLAWLADPANKSDPNYSDIFKDAYGYRPRG